MCVYACVHACPNGGFLCSVRLSYGHIHFCACNHTYAAYTYSTHTAHTLQHTHKCGAISQGCGRGSGKYSSPVIAPIRCIPPPPLPGALLAPSPPLADVPLLEMSDIKTVPNSVNLASTTQEERVGGERKHRRAAGHHAHVCWLPIV